jgi:hypothetical protein
MERPHSKLPVIIGLRLPNLSKKNVGNSEPKKNMPE